MALTDAAQIGSNDTYVGNAGLGAVNGGAIQIDTRPLRELASYTFAYNKAAYEQKQKEKEAEAQQLANITAYDLTTAIPKDREEIQKGYDELYNYVRENPTVLDYKNNQKGWMEYNKKKNEFENKLKGGKTRDILYKVREEEVSKATTPAMKAFLQSQLDNEANSTDLNTPLKHTQLFDLTPVEVTAPPSRKLDVTRVGANFYVSRTFELPDMASVKAQATTKALGFAQTEFDENSPEFKSKTPQEQQLLREQFKAQSAAGKLEPVESSNNISAVLADPKYKDAKYLNEDGSVKLDEVIKDNSGNGLVAGVLSSIKQYNDKMEEMQTQIKSGYFKDKLGNVLSFGSGGLKESDYSKIDISDGVTPNELLQVRILGLAKPESFATKVDQTNLGIAQQNADTSRGQLAETIRNNKAKLALDTKQFKLNEDKWKSSMTGGETQINGAMVKAKRIYSDMLKLADKNGVISPDKVRQLNSEQLKYLGIESVETSDAGVAKSVFKPLDLSMGEDKSKPNKYAIQLINGEIRVLGNAVPSETGSGSYKGRFDPSKSTNIYNVGTNILNEAVKNSSGKELNAYMGVDVNGDITSSTDGGSATVQGSTANKESSSQEEPVYSREEYKAAGWTDKQIELALKAGKIKVK